VSDTRDWVLGGGCGGSNKKGDAENNSGNTVSLVIVAGGIFEGQLFSIVAVGSMISSQAENESQEPLVKTRDPLFQQKYFRLCNCYVSPCSFLRCKPTTEKVVRGK
jgi:hypothetical protein